MKAIILCAGQGKRLHPLTAKCPKGMVNIGGKPIIERQIEQFKKFGIDDIVIVKGYKEESVLDYGAKHYVNSEFDSTNMVYSLFSAGEELEGDVIISYGDILYSAQILKQLLNSQSSVSVIIDMNWKEYFAQRVDDPYQEAESLCINEKREIISIGKDSPDVEDVQAQYIGLMKFNQHGIDLIKNIHFEAIKENREIGWARPFRTAHMTDLLQEIINRGHSILGVPIKGGWFEVDTIRDYELASRMLDENPDLK